MWDGWDCVVIVSECWCCGQLNGVLCVVACGGVVGVGLFGGLVVERIGFL